MKQNQKQKEKQDYFWYQIWLDIENHGFSALIDKQKNAVKDLIAQKIFNLSSIFKNWNKQSVILQLSKEELHTLNTTNKLTIQVKTGFPNAYNRFLYNKFTIILTLALLEEYEEHEIFVSSTLSKKDWNQPTYTLPINNIQLQKLNNSQHIKTTAIIPFRNKYFNFKINTLFLTLSITACDHTNDNRQITLEHNGHTINLNKTNNDHLNIYFNAKYLRDIHFSANEKGETIPQLFAIHNFTKHRTLFNGNKFYLWGEK